MVPTAEAKRDFRAELADVRCWDAEVQRVFEARGEPLVDCVLQNREELIALCELIDAHALRSYLEIGVWTGRLVSTLQRLFSFDRVASCDHKWAERCGFELTLPAEAHFIDADSDSSELASFLAEQPPFDLVFIDADHSYAAVKRDFELCRAGGHRVIALHDICGANRYTRGVARFWSELEEGHKLELIRPHLELGLDHSTMGIGLWSAGGLLRDS